MRTHIAIQRRVKTRTYSCAQWHQILMQRHLTKWSWQSWRQAMGLESYMARKHNLVKKVWTSAKMSSISKLCMTWKQTPCLWRNLLDQACTTEWLRRHSGTPQKITWTDQKKIWVGCRQRHLTKWSWQSLKTSHGVGELHGKETQLGEGVNLCKD